MSGTELRSFGLFQGLIRKLRTTIFKIRAHQEEMERWLKQLKFFWAKYKFHLQLRIL
ncbi:MAG: hypothetical protein AVDCRST_MAG96-1682 [uncultured Segetibacter sp.]|uniref:Uncharacterized protein n=1 Tax=uncultured Segetibacter sp. TaxID=481133 RepID=A0A6J4SFW2_9BACT|nr:MAG: hypothetical protein AVDCRST_MAG96-1682 [uncultured Segetibacter sp.]